MRLIAGATGRTKRFHIDELDEREVDQPVRAPNLADRADGSRFVALKQVRSG